MLVPRFQLWPVALTFTVPSEKGELHFFLLEKGGLDWKCRRRRKREGCRVLPPSLNNYRFRFSRNNFD